jgi:hypothetical protein
MKESNLHQKTKKQEFYHLIKEIYEQLLSVWGKSTFLIYYSQIETIEKIEIYLGINHSND